MQIIGTESWCITLYSTLSGQGKIKTVSVNIWRAHHPTKQQNLNQTYGGPSIKQQNSCKVRCLLGDFNSVRKPEERRNIGMDGTNRCEIQEFNNFIYKSNVNDLYMWLGKNTLGIDQMEWQKVALIES